MSEQGDTYEDYMLIAEAMAGAADSFRATEARDWLDISARGRFIREKQDAAAGWAQAAQALRQRKQVQP